MEYVIFAAALLGILILLFLKGLYDYRQEQKRFRKRLHTDYGRSWNGNTDRSGLRISVVIRINMPENFRLMKLPGAI